MTEWTCAGCGIPSPDTMRSCACPTNVVTWDRRQAWKRDTKDDEALADAIRLVEASGYVVSPKHLSHVRTSEAGQ